jgi:hypothetical protein
LMADVPFDSVFVTSVVKDQHEDSRVRASPVHVQEQFRKYVLGKTLGLLRS